MPSRNNHIDYVEFYANDLVAIKKFYSECFGWKFTDYGDSYVAFESSGMEGGFEYTSKPISNGALIVIYHRDLESAKAKVQSCGGEIVKEIFSFPGGQRFQFKDPSGNELAVWKVTEE